MAPTASLPHSMSPRMALKTASAALRRASGEALAPLCCPAVRLSDRFTLQIWHGSQGVSTWKLTRPGLRPVDPAESASPRSVRSFRYGSCPAATRGRRMGTEPNRYDRSYQGSHAWPQAFTTELAGEVRARRAALRLSQQDLADMAGVSERFVRFVEQGKPSVQLDSLLAVLETLGPGAAARHPDQGSGPRAGEPAVGAPRGLPAVGRAPDAAAAAGAAAAGRARP